MKTKLEIVQASVQKANHLSPSDFQDYSNENPDLLIIDLRTEAEFNAGHIKGAINMNKGYVETILAEKITDITDETKIVLYCIGGGISAMTQLALKEYGYKNVLDIAGGITNYVKKGYSLFNILGEYKFEKFGATE